MNPMRDNNEGTYRGGGGGDDTCDHGLSRTSLKGKPPTSKESKSDGTKKKKKEKTGLQS